MKATNRKRKIRCALGFHKWDRWQDIQKNTLYTEQERKCIECGLKQRRDTIFN